MGGVRGAQQGAAQGERNHLLRDVVAVLGATETVRDPGSRQIFLRELTEAFGGDFQYREIQMLQAQLVELVRCCLARSGGLRTLAEVVELLEPGGVQTLALMRLAEEWQVRQQFGAHHLHLLRVELSNRPLTERLRRLVFEAQGEALPGHCESEWHAFVYLACLNPLNGAPLWLRFLQQALPATTLRPDSGLRELLVELAEEWAAADDLPSTNNAPNQPTVGYRSAYLVIQFEKYGGDEDSYLVSHWHQWASPYWRPIRGEDRRVPRGDLESVVDQLVCEAERRWADQSGPVTLEFVLPWQLLNEPVDLWRRELASAHPSPLTAEYPLVIRSLERMRALQWHRLWRGRWEAVKGFVSTSTWVYCAAAGQPDVAIEALIKQEGGVVVLVLSEPPLPSGDGERQLLAGVRAGMPAVVWHRGSFAPSAVRDALTSLVDGVNSESGIAQLPRLVAQLRQSAWAEAPSGRGHIGHGLVVLWDDPERQPERTGSAGVDTEEVRA